MIHVSHWNKCNTLCEFRQVPFEKKEDDSCGKYFKDSGKREKCIPAFRQGSRAAYEIVPAAGSGGSHGGKAV